jgi:hypothetical protein
MPSLMHMYAVKQVLRYLQGTFTFGITYHPPPLQLQDYSYVNWTSNMDRKRSITRYIVILNNGTIAWKSHWQPTIALWTMESEYMALTDATKELKSVRMLFAELSYSNGKFHDEPIDLFSDNHGTIAHSKNLVSHSQAKHINPHYYFVRESIQDKIIWA